MLFIEKERAVVKATKEELESLNKAKRNNPKHTVNPHELKSLEVRLTKALAEQTAIQEEIKSARKKEALINSQVTELRSKITSLQQKTVEPIISEHAILRYLERVKGINLDQVRSEMIDDRARDAIKFARSGNYIKDGITYVFKNNTIITVT